MVSEVEARLKESEEHRAPLHLGKPYNPALLLLLRLP